MDGGCTDEWQESIWTLTRHTYGYGKGDIDIVYVGRMLMKGRRRASLYACFGDVGNGDEKDRVSKR